MLTKCLIGEENNSHITFDYIPEDMVNNILDMYHKCLLASHQGVVKIELTIRTVYIANLMPHLCGIHVFVKHAKSIF